MGIHKWKKFGYGGGRFRRRGEAQKMFREGLELQVQKM
jgi:hypothetical protein